MNRKEWLLDHSSFAMNEAKDILSSIKTERKKEREIDKEISVLSDMLDTARREPVYAVPHDLERLKKQCLMHGISYTMSGIFSDMVYLDLTSLSEKTRKHIMKYLKSMTVHVTVKNDDDFSWGYTARLTPTVQKMRK